MNIINCKNIFEYCLEQKINTAPDNTNAIRHETSQKVYRWK